MRAALIFPALALAACNNAPAPTFVVADLKPSDQAEITGWYVANESFRSFRLYPTDDEHYAKGGGQCLSGIASSLAGVPPETMDGRKVTITGQLYTSGAPDLGDTPNDCGAAVMMIANDIVYADEK